MSLAVVSITHSTFLTDATAHLVAMPATVVAGELLVCFLATDGSATVTTPSGWTALYSAPQSTTVRGSAYAKNAVGTEGGTTVDFVTSAAEQAAAQVYRFTGNLEVITYSIGTVVASAGAGVTTVDPPSVTASWGAADNLFIACVAMSAALTLVSGPSGWGTPVTTNDGGGGQAAASASCYTSILASANASENPGVFTFSGTGPVTLSNTIVIRSKVGSIGLPVNTLAGATVNATTQVLSIPAVAAGRILLITSHGRRASTTLAPDDPTLADSSAAPLIWTPVFAPVPVMIGVNPGTKAQWWWAISDGAAKTVTLTWANAGSIFSSVADLAIGAGLTPNFINQVWAASSGTPSGAVTATYPIAPTTGINFLSFYGAGGSTSTIATGYTSLTFVASTPYRTGYDITPGNDAVMGAGFLDQILCAVNITDTAPAGPQGAKTMVWSGSAWVEKPMMRWSGSAWLQEAPKVWSGVAWVSSALPPLPSLGWTPAEITIGMFAWWDPSVAASLTFSGVNLLEMADQSPANHKIGRAASSGPIATTINGLGALQYAPGQGIATPATPVFYDFTVCAVFKPGNTVPDYERVVDHAYATGWWIGRTGNTETWGGGVLDGPGTGYGRFVSLANGEVHQISSMRKIDQHTISGNGGASLLTATVTAAATTAQRVTIADDQGNLSPLTGVVAEAIVWSRALSASDLARTEGYLAWKWGIQAKLPAGHPYKSAAPAVPPPATAPTDTLVLSHTPGSGRNDYTGEVGMRLGIGPADVPFEWIGIRNNGGVVGPYRVSVYEWFANTVISYADINLTGTALGDWAWVKVAQTTLLANGYYSVALKVTAGDGQTWSNPGATSLKPAIVNTYAVYRGSTAEAFSTGVIDTQFVGLDLGW